MHVAAQPNSQQQAIIDSQAASLFVDAGAGSGKTTLIAHLAMHHVQRGVAVDKIGLFTVSRNAASHLNNLLQAMEQRHGLSLPRAVTLHSLCGSLLWRAQRLKLVWGAEEGLLQSDDPQLSALLTQAIEAMVARYQESSEAAELDFPIASPGNLQALYEAIAMVKGQRLIDFAEALAAGRDLDLFDLAVRAGQPATLLACMLEFERLRERRQLRTYADLVNEVIDLAHSSPRAKGLFASFEVVAVDEANDLSTALLQAALLARAKTGRLVLVGDRNQCVQQARGAHSSVLGAVVRKALPDIVEMPLSVCYRFAANLGRRLLLLPMLQGGSKKASASVDHKTTIRLHQIVAAAEIADLALTLRSKHPEQALAVLYRSRGEAFEFERAMIDAGKPYQMLGHLSLPAERMFRGGVGLMAAPVGLLDELAPRLRLDLAVQAVQALLPEWQDALAQAFKDCYPADAHIPRSGLECLRQAMEAATLKLPETARVNDRLNRLREHLQWREGEAGRSASPADILLDLPLRDWARADLLDADERALVEAILGEVFSERFAHGGSVKALVGFVQRAEKANVSATRRSAGAGLVLSTFLRAKGREFDTVILGDASSDRLPLPVQAEDLLSDPGERLRAEHNLFYVAITRTREALHIAYREPAGPCEWVARLLKLPLPATSVVAAPPADPLAVEPAPTKTPPPRKGEGFAAFRDFAERMRSDG
ncbi:UvrD-helicase domain-containing protein [Chitinimonas sp.]|uniref:UvrD-helicase domain-containing protein n=1 Tax=Chitinimonas sp. TaxID=1934313 RepID=UPI0035B366CE